MKIEINNNVIEIENEMVMRHYMALYPKIKNWVENELELIFDLLKILFISFNWVKDDFEKCKEFVLNLNMADFQKLSESIMPIMNNTEKKTK